MKHEHLNPDIGIARDDASQPSRRDVLALAGSGLFLFFQTQPLAAFQGPGQFPGQAGTVDFNTYLRIGPDGRVTCFTGKIEMGQGNTSALAQLLAEELDVAYDSVDMVMGDTDLCPYDAGTYGSLSIRQFGPVLRGAGAEARAVLLQLAAEQLQSPAERLQVKAGVVTDPSAPAKRVTYAQLVQGKRIERHLPERAGKARQGVHGSRAVATPQGRSRKGHREGQVLRRLPSRGRAARADPPAAGA